MTDSGQEPAQQGEGERTVGIVWPDDIGADAEAVNQVLFAWDQTHRSVVYMYLGHVPPPPWLNEEIATERLAVTGNKIAVQSKGSFILSRERAEEFWVALGVHLGRLER